MIVMQVDDRFRLEGDRDGWTVQRYAGIDPRTTKPMWKVVRRCPDLLHAYSTLAALEVTSPPEVSVAFVWLAALEQRTGRTAGELLDSLGRKSGDEDV